MPSSLNHTQRHGKRPRFWLGPFVAGCCIAFGYGLTNRLISIQEVLLNPEMSRFKQEVFPGIPLRSLNFPDYEDSEDIKVKLVRLQDEPNDLGDKQNESIVTPEPSWKEEMVISALNPLKPRFAFPVLPSLALDTFELKLFFQQVINQSSFSSRFILLEGLRPVPFKTSPEHQFLQ